MDETTPVWPSLVGLLRSQAREHAGKTAYTFLTDGRTPGPPLSFAELDRRARALGARLQGLNAGGERALLLFPPGLDFLVAFWGCLYAGTTSIPAPPPDALRLKRTLPRLKGIAEDARAGFVLTTAEVLARLEEFYDCLPSLRDLRWLDSAALGPGLEEAWRPPDAAHETLAYLQYTSGSTSAPKGVMVSHGNLLAHSESIRQGCGYTPDSVTVTWLPHFHDYGLIQGLLQPLYNGNPCYVMSPLAFIKRPLRWLEAIARYRGTHSQAPNFAFDLCVRHSTSEQRAALDLSCWEYAGNGAEPVHLDTLERFCAAFGPSGFRREALAPAYGLAEATLVVSSARKGEGPSHCWARSADLERHRVAEALPGERGARAAVSCGRPMPGRTVAVVDPATCRRCAPDEVGEIWVSDAGVARGYWGRPEETEQTFAARIEHEPGAGPFLRTGDLGFLRNGEVFVTGRHKDLVIVGGANHYPQDIERTVEACHPGVRPAGSAAFSVEVEGEERLVVLAELERGAVPRAPSASDGTRGPRAGAWGLWGGAAEPEAVLAVVRSAVAEAHEVEPHAVALLPSGSVFKTSSGKIQRAACRAAFLEGSLPLVAAWTRPPRPQGARGAGQDGPATRTAQSVREWLLARLADGLGMDAAAIDAHEPLAHYGLVSRDAVRLVGELEDWLGRRLSPVLVYQYPTVAALAAHLAGEPEGSLAESPRGAPGEREPVAVVGIGCRFPGAAGPEAFWRLLRDGVDAVTEVPAGRWDLGEWYGPDAPGKMSTRWGGFLPHVDHFDAPFFGIVAAEAAGMDPQQRLLLETAWEALEHAGLVPERLAGSRTGVFVGVSTDDYGRMQLGDAGRLGAYSGTGSALSIAANRLSYFFDFRAPSLAVDTACSSSLVAVHLAVEALRAGRADLALAGGVNLILSPEWTVTFSQARMMSPGGRCKTFDAAADGYVRGEGCGLVVLKRLSDALRDGDNVLALVRGSAVNQDGKSNGLTAPNGLAQQAVVRQALDDGGASAAEVGYVEAHGTGTPLGDPIEVQALAAVLGPDRPPGRPLLLGSVKTNIGHLESAAGIAGLIKVVLAMQHGEVPPHLHFREPNSLIPWNDLPVTVPTAATPWPEGCRFAGVSSFGFGGTNAHVVLVGAPYVPQARSASEGKHPLACASGLWQSTVLTLSARSEEALRELAGRYAMHLAAHPDEALADVCSAAHTTRSAFPHRLALVAASSAEAEGRLRAFAGGGEAPGLLRGQVRGSTRPRVALLFTGQGSQYVGMGRQLYETCPSFRRELDRCAGLLAPHLGRPLLDVIFPAEGMESPLGQTAYTQPALFALEYALAQLWLSWGVEPFAVLGHSLGEYVAACVAGVLTLEDALKLVVTRARLMQGLPPGGAMAAVRADEARVAEVLRPYAGRLSIAALNGPSNTVVSGEAAALEEVLTRLQAEGASAQRLDVSHAFHSPLIEPMLDEFERAAAGAAYGAARLGVVSNLTGAMASEGELVSAAYWRRHAREPVRFADGVRALREAGADVFIEVGPGTALLGMARRCVPDGDYGWLPSLRKGRDDRTVMLESLGALHVLGVPIDGDVLDSGGPRQRLVLPTYPFQRQRYWLEGTPTPAPTRVAAETAEGLYELRWLPRPRPRAAGAPPARSGCWLVLADGDGVGDDLARRLEGAGQDCVRVRPAENWGRSETGDVLIDPDRPDDFRRLLAEGLGGRSLLGAVHLWGLDAPPQTGEAFLRSAASGCAAVASLVQALAGSGAAARVWLVTRGAQPVGDPLPLMLAPSPLWGLGRVLAREHPELWGGLIDLDPQAGPDASAVWEELQDSGGEDQLAFRGDQRYVARLVVRGERSSPAPLCLRPDATYLIAGGLGALGLRVARWLVGGGARHLVLTGRRAPSAAAAEVIAGLERSGARVRAVQADVARAEDVARLLSDVAGLPPLAGLVHAAGVLDDGVLLRLDRSRFEKVMAAKVAGAWNLHEQSRGLPLDFFVMFSSAASLLGSPGQANYASANAFLDALAHHRRAEGLPALCINWGPWEGEGMAAGRRWEAMGLVPIAPERGLGVLGGLLQQGAVQVALIPGDWPRRTGPMPLLSDLVSRSSGPDLLRRVRDASPAERPGILEAAVRAAVGPLLGPSAPAQLDGRRGFMDLGMDSLMAVELRNRLQAQLELSPPLPASLLFDHPTIDALAAYLASRVTPGERRGVSCHKTPVGDHRRADAAPLPRPAGSRRAALPVREGEPIAVVGLGCRFPGAPGPDHFWRLLAAGDDAVGEVPRDRWDVDAFYDPDPDAPGKMYNRWGGFVPDVDRFDAAFFGIAPREAVTLDPQQRLLLEVAWEALEYAGIAPDRLAASSTGVFVGISGSDYGQLLTMSGGPARIDTYYGTGNALSAAAGRLSYVLGLRGPSLAVDTACSSSLVAVHLACQSLLRGECDAALAGGVSLILSPVATVNLCRARMLARDARCKTFDAAADGYVRGEGCGVVVLKRLSDAVRDGDNVLALVRGSAVNQDGRSSGLTAPNGPAQEAVIRAALVAGGIDPTRVSYVEAHGTGTPLGDPIEIQALAAVLGAGRGADRAVAIGSVKTNIGHLEAAAGIAGLIKVVLALRSRQIPPHLHFERPNPHVAWGELPVRVPTALAAWASDGPRVAGVSSFGFIGTNAHVVLEEAPDVGQASSLPVTEPDRERPLQVLTLSARSEEALRELAGRWETFLAAHPELDLADVAFTANTGRAALPHRLAVIAASVTDARERLAAFASGGPPPGLRAGRDERPTPLEALAARYVGGDAVDWAALDRGHARRKIIAPTYPFQRQRYWLDAPGPGPRGAGEGSSLLGRRLRSALKERVYEAVWGTNHFPVLRGHRLFGQVVVPGAWHLAVLLEAARRELRAEPCELEGVTFREALVLPDGEGCTVQLVLAPSSALPSPARGEGNGEGGFAFQLFSERSNAGEAEAGWVLHAAGRLRAGRAEGDVAARRAGGPAELVARCPHARERDDFYRTMAGVGIELGGPFRWLDEIRVGRNEAVARLRTAGDREAALASLPPGLIDSCFQLVAAALRRGPSRAYVPLGLDRLRFFGRRGGALWCHAALRPGAGRNDMLTADVRLLEEDGRLVAAFEGLHARRAAAETLKHGAPPAPAATSDLLRRHGAAPEHGRRDLLVDFVRARAAEVLRLPAAQAPGPKVRLFEAGMDSLMAIELRARLQEGVGRPLPATVVFDHPTVEALADYLSAQVLGAAPAGESSLPDEQPGAVPAPPEEGLGDLSDAELEELLEQKLESLRQRQTP